MGTKKKVEGVKEYELILDIFDCQIISVIGESSEEILDYLEEKWGYDEADTDFRGYSDIVPSSEYTMTIFTLFVKEFLTPGTISHESFHAVNFLTAHLGIRDEETSAYLLDWIVDKQHEFYKKELPLWNKK